MMSSEKSQHQFRIKSSSITSQEESKTELACDLNAVKVIENLKIKIGDAKRLTSGRKDVRNCYCSVQLDCEEVFKTRVIEKTSSPFFQEEFEFDIPHPFHFLSFYLHELQGDVLSKRDNVFAKVVIKKSDLIVSSGRDRWHPLVAVGSGEEVQGQIFVNMKFDRTFTLSQSQCADDSYKLIVRFNLQSAAVEDCSWVSSQPPGIANFIAQNCLILPLRVCRMYLEKSYLKSGIPECSGLFSTSGSCDPFVAVTLQGIHRSETRKSRVRKGSCNPAFEDEFVFELNKANSLRRSWFDLTLGGGAESKSMEPERWSLQILKICVYNAGTLGDVFMGEVRILLSDAPQTHSGWYLLNARSDKSSTTKEEQGSLRTKVTYTKDLVFPSETYQQLLDGLLNSSVKNDLSSSWPALIGAICGTKKHLVVAQHLVRIFLHQGKLLSLVVPLADAEISATTNLHSVFRSSSLSSYVIEESLRLVGRSYLCKVLSEEVERVKGEGRSCEVDPARLSLSNGVLPSRGPDSPAMNNESLASNKANLWKYVYSMFSTIVSSSPDCPALLCGIFNELRSSAASHFPDNLNVRYKAVTNFLFLRFFCTALLCPRKYKLVSSDLSSTATRTLTLVAKCLQHLCTLALPRPPTQSSAEAYLRNFLSELVTAELLDKLKKFIDVVSSAPGSSSRTSQQPVEKVTLKEGLMVKRAQGRSFLLGRKNFKTRYFWLTNYEFSYGKDRRAKPLCVIPVQQIQGIEKLQEESFRMANMFQVIQQNRVLYCKASNSVEQKEWMDALTKVCNYNSNRAQFYHPGAYIQGKYTCCNASLFRAAGCTSVTGLPTAVRLNIDQDRDLERLYVVLSNSHEKIRALQEECGARSVYMGPQPPLNPCVDSEAENTDDGEGGVPESTPKPLPLPLDSMDPQQTYRTLTAILDCVQFLDRVHSAYGEAVKRHSAIEGSKDKPFSGT